MKQTFDQFRLSCYRTLLRETKDHLNKMLAFRASTNEVTLGFLDGIEEKYEEEISRYKFKIKMYKPRKEGEKTNFLSHQDIEIAKSIPIKNFIKVNRQRKANCLFHDDKNASMHDYGTSFYCFSCQASGSTVDIIMKLHNKTFKDAVLFLVGK